LTGAPVPSISTKQSRAIKMKSIPTGAFSLFLLFCVAAAFAGDIREVRVQFKANQSGATIEGSIKGRQSIDYLLKAKAGQSLIVSLSTSNLSNYFNVLPPGSETALFVGSTSGNDWTGTLPADGDYTVRVYLMRSAARRNEKASYTLSVKLSGDSSSESRPGDAEVHLADPGYDVTLHKNPLRVLRFASGKVTSPDPMARVTAEKKGDEWSIGIDDFYFYVIPEAVIDGG
jgi:hypothetical protein